MVIGKNGMFFVIWRVKVIGKVGAEPIHRMFYNRNSNVRQSISPNCFYHKKAIEISSWDQQPSCWLLYNESVSMPAKSCAKDKQPQSVV